MSIRSRTDANVLVEAKRMAEAVGAFGKLPRQLGVRAMANRVAAFDAAIWEASTASAARARAVAEKMRVRTDLCMHMAQVRAAVKGLYGADSTQYADVGGTRASARKRPKRKHANGDAEVLNAEAPGPAPAE
jgi:hypothetical protein